MRNYVPEHPFVARPKSRLYRQEDGSFCDVSPAFAGKTKARCVMSWPLAKKFIDMGLFRVEEADQLGRPTVLVGD